MKTLTLAMLACVPLFAQPSCIQITDTLGALGPSTTGLMNGTIDLTISYTAQAGGGVVVQSSAQTTVANGLLSFCAPPTARITAVYSVRKPAPLTGAVGYVRYWTIPASGGPYTIQDIEGTTATSPSTTVSLSQIASGGASNGQALAWNGSIFAPQNTGISVYSRVVSAQTSVTVPPSVHGLTGSNFIVQCSGIAECGAVNVSPSGTVTVTSVVPWTGTLYIITSPHAYSLAFSAALTSAVMWPGHLLTEVSAMACYDSAGNQFGSGPFSVLPHDAGISGMLDVPDISVTLSNSTSQTGRCVLIGN